MATDEMKYRHVVRAIMETPWAILPAKLTAIVELAAFWAGGGKLTAEEVRTTIGAATKPQYRTQGQIAVLPLFGVIAPRADLFTEISGGTSVERFRARFREALNNPDVGAIVLDVDSPGGTVSLVDELSSEIYRARGTKPIIAVANPLAASAAYWIATAADELVVTPSGEVGSIGVWAAHEDWSRALDAEGITVSLISAGKYKTEGNPYEPLGEEARAAIQARIDDYYGMFVKAVARNRGVKSADVRNGFGEGRVVGARDAVASGMADRIETIDDVIDRLQRGRKSSKSAAADTDFRKRRLRANSY